jgi:hypothetical protein
VVPAYEDAVTQRHLVLYQSDVVLMIADSGSGRIVSAPCMRYDLWCHLIGQRPETIHPETRVYVDLHALQPLVPLDRAEIRDYTSQDKSVCGFFCNSPFC